MENANEEKGGKTKSLSPVAVYYAVFGCLLEVMAENMIPATYGDLHKAVELTIRYERHIPATFLYERCILKKTWSQIEKDVGHEASSISSTVARFMRLCRAYLLEAYHKRVFNNSTDLNFFPLQALPITNSKYNQIYSYLQKELPYQKEYSLAHLFALIKSNEIRYVGNVGDAYVKHLENLLARFYGEDQPWYNNIHTFCYQPYLSLHCSKEDYIYPEDQPDIKIPGLGERIREAVNQRGKTAEEACSSLKIHSTAWQGFMNGTEIPSMETLISIADYTNTTLAYLLMGQKGN